MSNFWGSLHSEGGDWVLKGSVSGNSRGHVTYGAGVGYQW